MDMVERVARAMAVDDGYDPDETWEGFDRMAAATDMMFGGVSEDEIFPKFVRWREYEIHAKSAVRAMLDGQEPVAWRYFIKSPEAGMGKTLLRTSRDPHLVDDGWTETPLYDLSALKEVVG